MPALVAIEPVTPEVAKAKLARFCTSGPERQPQPLPEMGWRPLLMLSAAVALFAVLLPLGGLAVTSLLVVICSGFAAYDVKLRENALLGLALAIFAVLLFVIVLTMISGARELLTPGAWEQNGGTYELNGPAAGSKLESPPQP